MWALARLVDSDRTVAVPHLATALPPDACAEVVDTALSRVDRIEGATNACYLASALLLHSYPAASFTAGARMRDVVVRIAPKAL